MKVVRVILGFVVVAVLVVTRPDLSAVEREGPSGPSDPGEVYTLRVDKGKSRHVRFQMIDPRGDSLIEADQFEFILSPKGLIIRPAPPAAASSENGGHLRFESFQLFLPTDGSSMQMEATLEK